MDYVNEHFYQSVQQYEIKCENSSNSSGNISKNMMKTAMKK